MLSYWLQRQYQHKDFPFFWITVALWDLLYKGCESCTLKAISEGRLEGLGVDLSLLVSPLLPLRRGPPPVVC